MKINTARVEAIIELRALADRVVAQLGADLLLADRLGAERRRQAAGIEHCRPGS